jgi:hypothetical protein
MTDGDDHLAIQTLRKPFCGKDRKWILEERTQTAHQPGVEVKEIASHSQKVAPRTKRANLVPDMIIKFQQFLEGWDIFVLVLFRDVLIPIFDPGAKNTRAM